MARDTVEGSVMEVLDQAAAAIDTVERGGKHIKVKYTYKGAKLMITIPKSASDPRSVKNAVAQVRRDMKEVDRP